MSGIALTPQGLKRKAETPLASPPEPGQVLQDEPTGKIAPRSRVSYCRKRFFCFLLKNVSTIRQLPTVITPIVQTRPSSKTWMCE